MGVGRWVKPELVEPFMYSLRRLASGEGLMDAWGGRDTGVKNEGVGEKEDALVTGGDAEVIEGYVIDVEFVVPLPKEWIVGLGDRDICG